MDIKAINRQVIEQFRTGGEIEVPGIHRDRLVLLTTVGARSGRPYTTPMGLFGRDGDNVLVVASNVGAPAHPDWYRNLVANPRVRVEVADDAYDATAETVIGADRDRLWAELTEGFPFLAEHQAKTDRLIPIVRLARA